MTPRDVLKSLRILRAQSMPSSRDVVDETFERLGYSHGRITAEEARRNFDSLLRRFFDETLKVLEEHEQQVDAGMVLPKFVSAHQNDIERAREDMRRGGDDTIALQDTVVRLLQGWHETLRGLFLSISQSRKTRGGKDFEYQLQALLELAKIPHEVQAQKYRSDFILPSAQLLDTEKPKAVLLTAKRTLRERWQEVVDELEKVKCPNTYLATADDKITSNVVGEISKRNIYLVVWDSVNFDKFPDEPMVLGYSKFISVLTQHFLPQW